MLTKILTYQFPVITLSLSTFNFSPLRFLFHRLGFLPCYSPLTIYNLPFKYWGLRCGLGFPLFLLPFAPQSFYYNSKIQKYLSLTGIAENNNIIKKAKET